MITKQTEYGIRALVYLARHDDWVRISDLSEHTKIPFKFLQGIMLLLKKNRVIQAKRGKNGGIRLLKKPDEINVFDLINILDRKLMKDFYVINRKKNLSEQEVQMKKILDTGWTGIYKAWSGINLNDL